MSISTFDLFTIGIGPSSSHTVGPMKAAQLFAERLRTEGILSNVAEISVTLFGSLGATGRGHGSVAAIILGLEGEQPHLIDPSTTEARIAGVRSSESLRLAGEHPVAFVIDRAIVLKGRERLDFHPNGMRFDVWDSAGLLLESREYYSVGGGFVLDQDDIAQPVPSAIEEEVAHPFHSADQLVALTAATGRSISDLMLENELLWRSEESVRAGLLEIWAVMQECIANGEEHEGVLPGGLNVRRRAAVQRAKLDSEEVAADPLRAMEWVTLFALAVNEENAAGGRVVTAPTNGAAGIIPAVLSYYVKFVPGADDDGVVRFLLTAAAIGMLFKENASISGADVGCQGEVGSACSMAAGALAEVLGGSPAQVENAAEIGIEHNLGLTCDPVGGLVQIPCIERNAIASIKAITAARMAIRGDGNHHVSLDAAIKTMRETGADMSSKYKETSTGGLALNLNMVEC